MYKLLSKIDVSKACGPDGVPGRLLKEGASSLSKPLFELFNLSTSGGKLPAEWTSANFTPVFKKGNKHIISNYRPISLTCLTVKILEKLVFNHIEEFLVNENKLNSSQHGFRKRHSCQTQLLETVHQWTKSLDRGDSTHVIFLDFSKAFDTVPHQRLLLKLDNIGIRGNLLNWITGFLEGRRQRVLVDGQKSDWVKVTSGVPQGSILGPLLFLVYVNDIGDDLESHTRLFADDCTLFREVSSKHDSCALQHDLTNLYNW